MGTQRSLHDLTTEDDHALVAKATKDPDAFAALYRRYAVAVYRYCVVRLNSHERAEDATSRIFLKVVESLPNLRDGQAFRGWLFAIAHNVVSDEYRSRRQSWPLALLGERGDRSPGRSSTEDAALASVEWEDVRRLLNVVSPDQQRILELRLVGLTSQEIAEVLGKQPGAIKMAQSRAIARIRQSLERNADAEGLHRPQKLDPEESSHGSS